MNEVLTIDLSGPRTSMPHSAPPDLADEHGHSVQLHVVTTLKSALRSLPVGVAIGENLDHLAKVG